MRTEKGQAPGLRMTSRDNSPPIGAQYWLARRLERPDLFLGITTLEDRRERLRRAIVEGGLAHKRCGRHDGRVESFGEVFARLFSQPLHVEPAQPTGESEHG